MVQHKWVGELTGVWAKKAALLSAGVLGATLLWSGRAHAGIASCGDIDVKAEAKCELVASGGCTTRCTPANFTLACSAELYGTCQTDCTIEPPTCDCHVDCDATCAVDAGSFDCEGSCKGGCEANCTSRCEAADDQAQCEASCKATCSGECSGSCTGTASASCSGQCASSCTGECKALANMDCQATCQADGYARCETRLEGGCTTECKQAEGALFCDGQYVDRGDHAKECLAALNAYLKQHVTGGASSSGSCTGNTCQGEAEAHATAKCSINPGPQGSAISGVLSAAAMMLVVAARRSKKS